MLVSAHPFKNYAITTFQDISATKAVEQAILAEKEHLKIALQDSQANLADVQRMATLGSWIWDIQEGHFWMSAQNCRNLGFETEQQVPTYSESLHYVHPDDKVIIGSMVGRCLKQRLGVEFTFRVKWPNGQTRTLLSRHELECNSNQQPRRLKGFTQDITERKQAEEALASREAYLATLVELQYCLLAFEEEQIPYEHILALLSSATQAGRIVFFDNEFNEQGQWIMQVKAQWSLDASVPKIPQTSTYHPIWSRWAALLTEDEFISGFVDEFPEPERQVLIAQGVTSLLALPLKVNNEFSGFIRFDNCGHHRLWNASEIALLWAAAAAISLTQEQQQIKAALTESQQRFATVLDSIQSLIYVADMQTYEILFINQYGRQLFGDIEGQLCWQALQTEQTGPCPFCTNARLLKADGQPSGIHSWEFENTRVQHWYDIHDQAIPWTDGRLVRLEIATDITERKHAEQALRDSEARYRLLAEYATDLISRHTLAGVFLYASP
ncbi:MAG: PAS domain-containing protein, partial [Pseudomonadota bacterium]|nr:PAS domain-containing protein [Pseudomonadota bacterium]